MAIVELKDQVCPLYHALKLKEFGVVQSSLFQYVNGHKNPRGEQVNDGEVIIQSSEKLIYRKKSKGRGNKKECTFASAYTLSELCTLIPQKFRRSYYTFLYGRREPINEIKAVANYFINLLESKLISIEEVNDRFKPDNFEL